MSYRCLFLRTVFPAAFAVPTFPPGLTMPFFAFEGPPRDNTVGAILTLTRVVVVVVVGCL